VKLEILDPQDLPAYKVLWDHMDHLVKMDKMVKMEKLDHQA